MVMRPMPTCRHVTPHSSRATIISAPCPTLSLLPPASVTSAAKAYEEGACDGDAAPATAPAVASVASACKVGACDIDATPAPAVAPAATCEVGASVSAAAACEVDAAPAAAVCEVDASPAPAAAVCEVDAPPHTAAFAAAISAQEVDTPLPAGCVPCCCIACVAV